MIALHEFQCEAVEQIECEIAHEHCKLIYVAPTGSGKTVVAAEITRRAADRHQRVLFLVHRREIIDQTSRKLAANGIPLGMHGIVLAGRERDLRPQALVQVAFHCPQSSLASRIIAGLSGLQRGKWRRH